MSESESETANNTHIPLIEDYTYISSVDDVIALCRSPSGYVLSECIKVKEPRGKVQEYITAKKRTLDLDSLRVVFSNKESETAVNASSLINLLNILEIMQGGWPIVTRDAIQDLSHALKDYKVYIAKEASLSLPRLVFVFPAEDSNLFGVIAPVVVDEEEVSQ